MNFEENSWLRMNQRQKIIGNIFCFSCESRVSYLRKIKEGTSGGVLEYIRYSRTTPYGNPLKDVKTEDIENGIQTSK